MNHNDYPTPNPTPPTTVMLTEHTVAALAEVLGLCEEFLRTAGPTVHAELRGYLRAQWPPADPTWLIDMVGFHALHLHHQLPATAGSPRENWQPHHDHVDPRTLPPVTTNVTTEVVS